MSGSRHGTEGAVRPRALKARLADGEALLGGLVRMPAEETAEMMAVAGFDFVLIDCEHGPADLGVLRAHIAVAQVHGMATLVRPGAGEDALVLRALDQGADGIVAPHIDTREQAEALVRAAHYPPLGNRGFATYPRAGGFGTVSATDHRERRLADTLVLAMIESPIAVRNAETVLTCPGIDGYLVGTGDLAASTGPGDPSVEQAVAQVAEVARTVGAWRAELATSRAGAQQSVAAGANLVVHNIVHEVMGLFGELTAGG